MATAGGRLAGGVVDGLGRFVIPACAGMTEGGERVTVAGDDAGGVVGGVGLAAEVEAADDVA